MNNLKDFDITQINKDTKIVVFSVPSDIFFNEESLSMFETYARYITQTLKDIGVVALFVDDTMSVKPLTDELLKSGNLKSIDS